MTPFDASGKRSLWKTLWEKENLLVQAISHFPTMSSNLLKTEMIICVLFKFVVCKCFQFGQVQNLVVWERVKHKGPYELQERRDLIIHRNERF